MLGHITLIPEENWTQPADIHAWIDQLVEDYRQGAIIVQRVDRWTLAAILRRRWAGQITFGTLAIVPNKTPGESVDEWGDWGDHVFSPSEIARMDAGENV